LPLDIHVIDPATGNSVRVDRDGSLHVSASISITPVSSSLKIVHAMTGSGGLLLTAKTRDSFSVYNHSTSVLYLTFGDVASTSSFSVALLSNGFYESSNHYSGPVAGVWDSPVTGSAQVTEYT